MSSNNSRLSAPGEEFPRRSRWSRIIPGIVLALTVMLIAWSAWPTIQPIRTVTVTQAVFEMSSAIAPSRLDGSSNTRDGAPKGAIVQAPGWLEAEPYYIACTALADGVVESIFVLEGDAVRQGQVVAKLVAEDSALRLAHAESSLAHAQSEFALAQAELSAAEENWNEPIEQERAVESGEAALEESRAELELLPSQIDAERARLVELEEEHERISRSREVDAVNELEVIVARQRLAAQAARVETLEGRRPLLQARVDRLEAELRAARRNLALRIDDRRQLDASKAGLARARAAVQRAETTRDQAALELERMTIRAPIDGYVLRRLKLPGDKVVRMNDSPHSAHLVHLYDPDRLQVRVDVPLADAANLFVGQRCEVVVEIMPERIFAGEVLRITHEADLQKNTLQIKVQVIDPSPLLKPEMLTRVKFLPSGASDSADRPSDQPENRIVMVPPETIEEHNGGSRVWIVAERRGDRGILRAIQIEPTGGKDGWVAVHGEMVPGMLLVSSPENLRDGERVRIARPESGDAL